MSNRYADDLRRIIGIKDVGSGLSNAQLRPKIPGQRSTAYLDAGSGNVQNSTGAKGSGFNYSNAGSSRKGSETTSGGDTPYDGNYSNSGSLGAFDSLDDWTMLDPRQAEYEAGQLLDNLLGPSLGAKEKLSKITATDPDTGNQIDIIFGNSEYETPDGWNTWDDSGPGPDETFIAGYYYDSVTAGHFPSQSATEQVDKMIANYEATGLYSSISFVGYDPAIPPPPATGFFIATARFKLTLAGSGSIVDAGQGIHRFQCTGADPSGPGQYCSTIPPLTGPALTQWPVDNIIAFLSGEDFTASSYENPDDLVGFTQQGTGTLRINFGDGGLRTGEITRAGDGGLLLYETVNGNPSGNFKKYDIEGKLVDIGPVSEIPQHLPNND